MNSKMFKIFLCVFFFCLGFGVAFGFLTFSQTLSDDGEKPDAAAKMYRSVEFDDLLKRIAIPDTAGYSVHGERFLAESNTFVEWETEGVKDFQGPAITNGLGGVGRRGSVYIHFNGESMTKSLRKVVEEEPWGISWSGTFHMVFAVYLTAGISMQDYIDIADYLLAKGWGTTWDNPDPEKKYESTWMKVTIPGYRPLWMNVENDFGNSYGTLQLGFIYEAP